MTDNSCWKAIKNVKRQNLHKGLKIKVCIKIQLKIWSLKGINCLTVVRTADSSCQTAVTKFLTLES